MSEKNETSDISPEYASFLNYYQDFLTHYNYCQRIIVLIGKPYVKNQIYLPQLFQAALQAHIQAADSHRKTINAYQELQRKVVDALHKK